MTLRHISRTGIALIMAVAALGYEAVAQDVTWTPTNGPYGGDNISRVIAGRGTVVYAGSDYDLYVSTNRGDSWSKCARPTLAMSSMTAMAVDSSGNLLVGIHGMEASLYRTTDLGATWEDLRYPGQQIASIAVAPDGNVYAGGHGTPVVRSDDNGATWIETALRVETEDGIAVLGDGRVLAYAYSTSAQGVAYSTDNGATAHLATGTSDLPSDFAVCGDTVYFVTIDFWGDGLIWRSIDRGASYIRLDTLAGKLTIPSIGVDDNGTLYVGEFYQGVYKSADGGVSFQHVVPTFDYSPLLSLDVGDDGTVYCATNAGPWRTTDGGTTWEMIITGMRESIVTLYGASPQGDLYASTRSGSYSTRSNLYRSTDKGERWSMLADQPTSTTIIAGAVSSDNTLFVGDLVGWVYRYDPATETWTTSGTRVDTTVTALIVQRKPGDLSTTIVVGTSRGSIYRSQNMGETWTLLRRDTTPGGFVRGLATTSDGSIFSITGNACHRWTESNGWEWVTAVPAWRSLRSIDASGTHVVVVADDTGWASNDAGESWRPLPTIQRYVDDRSTRYNEATVTPRGWVVASYGGQDANGEYDLRVGLAAPGATEWTRIENGLDPTQFFLSFAHHPDGTIFAGGKGVYRTGGPVTDVEGAGEPSRQSQVVVEPMPATEQVAVRFTLSRGGRYRATLHDIDGGTILTFCDGELPRGESVLRLNLADIPSGIYFVQVIGAESKRGVVVRR